MGSRDTAAVFVRGWEQIWIIPGPQMDEKVIGQFVVWIEIISLWKSALCMAAAIDGATVKG